jgi:hypothetical protein
MWNLSVVSHRGTMCMALNIPSASPTSKWEFAIDTDSNPFSWECSMRMCLFLAAYNIKALDNNFSCSGALKTASIDDRSKDANGVGEN